MASVSQYRLLALRAYYALIALGTAAVFWPSLLSHTDHWGGENGAQYSLLAALSPLALLGLRYPLKMLPILVYEFLWKSLWFVFVAAPLWLHGQMTDEVWANVFACGLGVVLTPIVLPWSYVWKTYIADPLERWS